MYKTIQKCDGLIDYLVGGYCITLPVVSEYLAFGSKLMEFFTVFLGLVLVIARLRQEYKKYKISQKKK